MTSLLLLEIALISVCGITVGILAIGRFPTMMALLFFIFFAFSHGVLIFGSHSLHTGIAPAGPTFYTFTLLILVFGLVVLFSHRSNVSAPVFHPFVIYLAFSMAFVWERTSEQWAGFLAIAVAIVAWSVGLFLGQDLDRDGPSSQQFAFILLLTALLELGVSLLQLAGVKMFATDGATAELMGDRINGTFNHPGTLGKALLLLVLLLLPLTRSPAKRVKNIAYAGLLATFIPIISSGSRANLFGLMAMLILWALLLPREKKISGRVAFLGLFCVVAVSSIGILSARYAQDPAGETRIHFNRVALEQISARPFTGAGPNSYLTAASPSDSLTAQGWPVHNIFLLAATELGILGAVLMFVPTVVLVTSSLRLCRVNSMRGDFARSVVAFVPAFLVIGLTGWGMLNREILPLWFFVFGFSASLIRARKTCDAHEKPTPYSRSFRGSSTHLAQHR